MSASFSGRLHPLYLRAKASVDRALTVDCPICREQIGKPCKTDEGVPVVHDARESLAFHGKKIWA